MTDYNVCETLKAIGANDGLTIKQLLKRKITKQSAGAFKSMVYKIKEDGKIKQDYDGLYYITKGGEDYLESNSAPPTPTPTPTPTTTPTPTPAIIPRATTSTAAKFTLAEESYTHAQNVAAIQDKGDDETVIVTKAPVSKEKILSGDKMLENFRNCVAVETDAAMTEFIEKEAAREYTIVPEIRAMQEVDKAMGLLETDGEKRRVISWVADRYGRCPHD